MTELILKWKKFGLSKGLHDMLKAGQLLDVTLACQGEFIRAHKTALAACSIYFRDLFCMDFTNQNVVIFMQDVKLIHLRALLDFVYTGEATVSQDELPRFLKTAEALKICGLAGSSSNEEEETTKENESGSTSSESYSRSARKRARIEPEIQAETKPVQESNNEVELVDLSNHSSAIKLEADGSIDANDFWYDHVANQGVNNVDPIQEANPMPVGPASSFSNISTNQDSNSIHIQEPMAVQENSNFPSSFRLSEPPSSQHVELVENSGIYIVQLKKDFAAKRYINAPSNMVRYLLRNILGDDYIVAHSAKGARYGSTAADEYVLETIEAFTKSQSSALTEDMVPIYNKLSRDIKKMRKVKEGFYNSKNKKTK